MPTLRDQLLPVIDAARGIAAGFGLRLYTVTAVVRVWSGSRVGLGTKVDTPAQLFNATGGANVLVKNVSQRDVIASGGLYTTEDIQVGPLTPPFSGSTGDNDSVALFDPPVTGHPTEVLFYVTGPGYSGGAWFRRISQDLSSPFAYSIVLRKDGTVTP